MKKLLFSYVSKVVLGLGTFIIFIGIFFFIGSYFPRFACTLFFPSRMNKSCVEGMEKRKRDREQSDAHKLFPIQIGSQQLSVEIAKTVPEIMLGLGQRDTLGSDGMLFVMPTRQIPTFWMKDMRFNLDFVWIDTDRVVDLTENVSAQRGESDTALRLYSPKTAVTHVLELNAGEVQRRHIQINDNVVLSDKQ